MMIHCRNILFHLFYFSSSSLESLKFRHSEHTRKYSARFAAFERYQVISTFIHFYTQKFQGMVQEYLLRTICWEFVLKIWWFFNTNLKYLYFLNEKENHGNMKNIRACLVTVFENYYGKQFLKTIFKNSFLCFQNKK